MAITKIFIFHMTDTMEAAKQQRMADRQKAFQAKYKMTMEKEIDESKVRICDKNKIECDRPMNGPYNNMYSVYHSCSISIFIHSIPRTRRIAISTISIRTFRLRPKTSKSKISITNTSNTLRTKRWVGAKNLVARKKNSCKSL